MAAKPAAPARLIARILGLGALAGLLAALGACSAVGVLNAVEPKADVAITRGIAFMPGPRGGLDIYRPRNATAATPVVVFFYGGSWDSGARADYEFVGAALASEGFLAIVPDYRVYPEVRWPAFLQDNALAVRWAKDHAAAYGGDPHTLFLMGHSAGAYDAAMLGLDRRWLGAVGLDPSRDLRGMIGLAGPYDFLPVHTDELKAIFGPERTRPDTQPINHVDGHAPPMFLAADIGDTVVEASNTTRLAVKLRAAGDPVDEVYYKGLSHPLMIGVMAAPLRGLAPVRHDVAAWIRAHAQR
jgi:acetyl esterase/lipase